MELAPIVLFIYNRLENTKLLLESLSNNELANQSELYIYADGPKEGASEEVLSQIKEVRDFVANRNWCKKSHIIFSEKNLGCAPSIVNGVTEVVNKHGKVIVLEDDLNLSPYFLSYMNDALNTYEHNMKVSSIGACNFFACGEKFPSTFFMPYPDCWGWATWANRWDAFEYDANKLLQTLREKGLIDRFNGYGAYNMESLLIAQANNEVSAWDVQWTATCILNNWLTLYPNPSVSQHIYISKSTHANINVVPPLLSEKIQIENNEVKLIPHVWEAMKLGYSGKGDYYGNKIKTKIDRSFFKKSAMKPLNLLRKALSTLKKL